MTLDSSSLLDQIVARILRDGFYCEGSAAIGPKVDRMIETGLQFKSEDGLEFCKFHTFDNEIIRAAIESILSQSAMGLYMAFGYDTEHTFCFLSHTKPDVQALIVHLWSSGSKVIFYRASHLKSLRPKAAANGLLEIEDNALVDSAVEPIEVDLKDGGL